MLQSKNSQLELPKNLSNPTKSRLNRHQEVSKNEYVELFPSRLLGVDREQAETEVRLPSRGPFPLSIITNYHHSLLLTSKSLRAILQYSQKAAEPALRSLVADDSAYRSLTESAIGIHEHATGVSHFPATLALPMEALSSFQTTKFRALYLQPLYEGRSLIRRKTSLWRKTSLVIAALARAFVWPFILLHRHQGYYWISLAELHNTYMDEVIVPWVDEIARVVREETGPRRIATTVNVGIESRHRQVERLLALRCNVSAVLAVLL